MFERCKSMIRAATAIHDSRNMTISVESHCKGVIPSDKTLVHPPHAALIAAVHAQSATRLLGQLLICV